MSDKSLSHAEMAQRFVESKAFDFQAMGRWITELGPTLCSTTQTVRSATTVVLGQHHR